jgi:hypothetical protein
MTDHANRKWLKREIAETHEKKPKEEQLKHLISAECKTLATF